MAIEGKRKCGFRKAGGLYLVSGALAAPCGRLPMPLHICPACGQGIKQSRGFTWIEPAHLFAEHIKETACAAKYCDACPLGNPALMNDRDGLMWVGERYYTPKSFMAEAREMGISKRIGAIPRGFEIGKHRVYLAHPKACEVTVPGSGEMFEHVAGVFAVFLPERVEKIVTETEAADADAMADLEKRGITPVVVPDGDEDHNPDGMGNGNNATE